MIFAVFDRSRWFVGVAALAAAIVLIATGSAWTPAAGFQAPHLRPVIETL